MAQTKEVNVIYQEHLLQALRGDFLDNRGIRDWDDNFTSRLDPKGIMVVTLYFPHNDTLDYRVMALAKVKDSMKPVDVIFTLPARHTGLIEKATMK